MMFKSIMVVAGVLLMSSAVTAEGRAQCEVAADQLGARYHISESGKSTHTELELWREGDRVLHVRPAAGTAESYRQLSNGEVRRVSYFDEQARAIEYDPEAMDWSAKFQLLSAVALEKMTRTERSGKGCKVVERYERKLAGGTLSVWWNPELSLLLQLERKTKKSFTRMKLAKLTIDQPSIAAAFARRDSYATTDFADIGDNESDPFLKQAIRVGFSGHQH